MYTTAHLLASGALGSDRNTIPRTGLLFYAKPANIAITWNDDGTWNDSGTWEEMGVQLVDTIGLSTADYDKLGPIVQAIVSADGGTTLRTTSEIVALMAASDNLNQFNMLGDDTRNIWAIYDKDTDWAVLEKVRRYFKEAAWPISDIYYDFNAIERTRYGAIAWSGTPTIDADGVTAGDGPSFSDVIPWTSGKTLTVQFKATKSSTGITGDEQVFGPLYLRNGYLVAKDGTNTVIVASTWAIGDILVCGVDISTNGAMRVGRVS